MPPSKYSQYPMVGRISSNGIKNFKNKCHFERNEVESRNPFSNVFIKKK